MKFIRCLTLSVATGALTVAMATHASALSININAGAGLAGNAAALAAFQRAADMWEGIFSDPVTIEIEADLTNIGSSSIIGTAHSELLTAGYSSVRTSLIDDAANESNNAIVASLPTAMQFTAQVPTGFTLNNQIIATKANLKALGYDATTLDTIAGTTNDATITFNRGFAFDFDNSDGVSAGTKDFETVAAHEIAHALGFVSIVDIIDQLLINDQTSSVPVSTLDLFRISPANQPITTGDFSVATRELRPGEDASFTDVSDSYAMSTGSTANGGDGNQASHWKADELTGIYIGLLDPTLASGTISNITAADIRALDLIGWEHVVDQVPTADTLLMYLVGLVAVSFAALHRPRKFLA